MTTTKYTDLVAMKVNQQNLCAHSLGSYIISLAWNQILMANIHVTSLADIHVVLMFPVSQIMIMDPDKKFSFVMFVHIEKSCSCISNGMKHQNRNYLICYCWQEWISNILLKNWRKRLSTIIRLPGQAILLNQEKYCPSSKHRNW